MPVSVLLFNSVIFSYFNFLGKTQIITAFCATVASRFCKEILEFDKGQPSTKVFTKVKLNANYMALNARGVMDFQ